MVTRVGIYGPHTQVKCLLKALIFGTYINNILISSQIGFELYQSHSLTVTGLKSRGATEQSTLDERGQFHENSIPILKVEYSCIYNNLQNR